MNKYQKAIRQMVKDDLTLITPNSIFSYQFFKKVLEVETKKLSLEKIIHFKQQNKNINEKVRDYRSKKWH